MPGGKIRALILQPENAYLGNYRVPREHYAIQWDVEGEVTSSLSRSFPKVLLSAEAGSTLTQSWVCVMPGDIPLGNALRDAWKDYPDPFEPAAVAGMADRQVMHWRWRGSLASRFVVEWGIGAGWQVGVSKTLIRLVSGLKNQAGLRAELGVVQRGSFVLRISKRLKRVQVSVKRESMRRIKGGFSVRVAARSRVGLQSKSKLVTPLLKPLNQKMAQVVARRAEVVFSASAEKWRSNQALMKAVWKIPDRDFSTEYKALIHGKLPSRRPGLLVSGLFESRWDLPVT